MTINHLKFSRILVTDVKEVDVVKDAKIPQLYTKYSKTLTIYHYLYFLKA